MSFRPAFGILFFLVCSVGMAGETKIIKKTKTNLPMNNIQVDVEGTNELVNAEIFATWTPIFVRPDGTTALASIVAFQAPVANTGPKTFKIRIMIQNGGSNLGTWKTKSALNWMNPITYHLTTKEFSIP